MKVLLFRVIPAALLAAVFAGASPAFAQCARVEDGGCDEGNGCKVEGLWLSGSLGWPEEWSDACFESCPPPEHCAATLASLQETHGKLASALHEGDSVAILHLVGEPHVTFNADRGAIQFLGCDNETVIGHVTLSVHQAAVLNTAQSAQNMVARVVGF